MRGLVLCKVCGNCKNTYLEGDRYCRFCGAPMGTPVFIEEEFSCLYGPMPVRRTHKCEKCGHTWETIKMIDNERWCPKCGKPAPVVRSEDESDMLGDLFS